MQSTPVEPFVTVQSERDRAMALLSSLPCDGFELKTDPVWGGWRRCTDWMSNKRWRFNPVLKMVQKLFDDNWVFDAGNHLNRTATLHTGFDLDFEYAFEALGPGHGDVALSRSWVLVGRGFTAPGQCDL